MCIYRHVIILSVIKESDTLEKKIKSKRIHFHVSIFYHFDNAETVIFET